MGIWPARNWIIRGGGVLFPHPEDGPGLSPAWARAAGRAGRLLGRCFVYCTQIILHLGFFGQIICIFWPKWIILDSLGRSFVYLPKRNSILGFFGQIVCIFVKVIYFGVLWADSLYFWNPLGRIFVYLSQNFYFGILWADPLYILTKIIIILEFFGHILCIF